MKIHLVILKIDKTESKVLMFRWLFLLGLFLTTRAMAQQDYPGRLSPEETHFIKTILDQQKARGQLMTKLYRAEFERIQTTLKRDTMVSALPRFRNTRRDSFLLNAFDRKKLDTYLSALQNVEWRSGIINIQQFSFDKLLNPDTVVRDCIHPAYFSFLPPLFLRNNTLCIFYLEENCGCDCGGASLYVYRKTKRKWKYWLELYSWIN